MGLRRPCLWNLTIMVDGIKPVFFIRVRVTEKNRLILIEFDFIHIRTYIIFADPSK